MQICLPHVRKLGADAKFFILNEKEKNRKMTAKRGDKEKPAAGRPRGLYGGKASVPQPRQISATGLQLARSQGGNEGSSSRKQANPAGTLLCWDLPKGTGP